LAWGDYPFHPKDSNMMHSRRKGFTLVELLVVIAIIGILVAMIVPAVNVATGIARKNQCLANQRSWGQAMLQHATDKDAFPGRVSTVRTNYQSPNAPQLLAISWMTKLLPYIEKNAEWDQLLVVENFFVDPVPTTPEREKIELEIATCPSDPPESSGGWRSSYVVNTGVWDAEYTKMPVDSRFNGICHDLRKSDENRVDPAFVSKNDGAGTTILLSENVNALAWPVIEETLHGIVWMFEPWVKVPRGAKSGDQLYAINIGVDDMTDSQIEGLLNVPTQLGSTMIHYARPSSRHSGGVNVIFCDGHGSFLSEEVDWTVYKRLLTPSDQKATHPHVTAAQLNQMKNDAQLSKLFAPLSDTDLNP
jgi:prepilin-type N-terminal cleavage/methylation domain-containing protein/prepilin-type processing-associated H-X9-DG protein